MTEFKLYIEADNLSEWQEFVKSTALEGPAGRNRLIRALLEASKYREEATIEQQKEAYTKLEKAGRFVVDIGQGWYTVEYRGRREWVQGASLVRLASQLGGKKHSGKNTRPANDVVESKPSGESVGKTKPTKNSRKVSKSIKISRRGKRN